MAQNLFGYCDRLGSGNDLGIQMDVNSWVDPPLKPCLHPTEKNIALCYLFQNDANSFTLQVQ